MSKTSQSLPTTEIRVVYVALKPTNLNLNTAKSSNLILHHGIGPLQLSTKELNGRRLTYQNRNRGVPPARNYESYQSYNEWYLTRDAHHSESSESPSSELSESAESSSSELGDSSESSDSSVSLELAELSSAGGLIVDVLLLILNSNLD